MRRWSVGVEQRAASLSSGWLCANTDKSFYCTHTSTPLHCSSLLYYSLPLLHFLAHHLAVHFSCHFSVVFAFRCVFNADLHLWLPAFQTPSSQRSVWGYFECFPKSWAPCLNGRWCCFVGGVHRRHMAEWALTFLLMITCASQLGKDMGELSQMRD